MGWAWEPQLYPHAVRFLSIEVMPLSARIGWEPFKATPRGKGREGTKKRAKRDGEIGAIPFSVLLASFVEYTAVTFSGKVQRT